MRKAGKLKLLWIIIGIYLIFCTLLFQSCTKSNNNNVRGENFKINERNLTKKEQIIEAANKFLKSQGIVLKDKAVYYDNHNEEWRKTYKYITTHSYDYEKELEVLKGRDFQAVSYGPTNELTLGGIYWVFVDKDTGEVIHWFGMK
jgi:hypothetical protein